MKIICDWDNCKELGSYKAPVERDNVRKYRLLCLKHIKIFNKNWNYFENMSSDEIEYFIKSDLTWHKSTKSFGSSENFLVYCGIMLLKISLIFLKPIVLKILKNLICPPKIKTLLIY